ncbi:hypothetical protein [Streptomyces sp. NPDC048445]
MQMLRCTRDTTVLQPDDHHHQDHEQHPANHRRHPRYEDGSGRVALTGR